VFECAFSGLVSICLIVPSKILSITVLSGLTPIGPTLLVWASIPVCSVLVKALNFVWSISCVFLRVPWSFPWISNICWSLFLPGSISKSHLSYGVFCIRCFIIALKILSSILISVFQESVSLLCLVVISTIELATVSLVVLIGICQPVVSLFLGHLVSIAPFPIKPGCVTFSATAKLVVVHLIGSNSIISDPSVGNLQVFIGVVSSALSMCKSF